MIRKSVKLPAIMVKDENAPPLK